MNLRLVRRTLGGALATTVLVVPVAVAAATSPAVAVQASSAAPPVSAPTRCDGTLTTRSGTAGKDALVGTAAGDVISGLGGKDSVNGLSGNDTLCGDAAADTLVGGPGDDVLLGGPAKDLLDAGIGDDVIHPGGGRDVVAAGAGDDTVYAFDGGSDIITCGAGNDLVIADRADRVASSCERVVRRKANQVPTTPSLVLISVPENKPAGTMVGKLSAYDPDPGETLTFRLVGGAGDSDNSRFTVDGSILRSATTFDLEARATYTLRVRVTDGAGASAEKPFVVTVTNVNEAPTGLALTHASVQEGLPAGTPVGTLVTTDPDAGDFAEYTLVSGLGSGDNSWFTVDDKSLLTTGVFDAEGQASFSVRVRTTDSGGLSFEKVLTITVDNADEAPTDIALSTAVVAENQPVDTVVGSLSATDPDLADTHTFTLVPGANDNASFQVVGATLRTNAEFDREARSTYGVRVRVTDTGGLSYEKYFAVVVTDVNETPTDLALSNDVIAENQPSGTVVGTLSATDPDVGDSRTFSLVAGAVDNASFEVVGSELRTVEAFDFEVRASYDVLVRVTDGAGHTFDKTVTVTVTDVDEP